MEYTFWRRLLISKLSVLLHDIFIYYTCDYVSYTYFTVFVVECVCFEIFWLTSGLCVFVFVCILMCVCVCCVHVYVVYEDTNVYNDMGMTGITRIRGFMMTFSVSP